MIDRIFAIVEKDLRRELNSGEVISTSLLFAVVLIVISAFGFIENAGSVQLLFPGVLWIAIFFSATLVLNQTVDYETENNCIEALVLIPGASTQIFFGKYISNLLLIFVFELSFVPLSVVAFNVSFTDAPLLYLYAIVFVSAGYIALGTIVSMVLIAAKLRKIFLPLILFPLAMPLFIAGIKLVQGGLGQGQADLMFDWAAIVLAMDGIYIFGGALMFSWILDGVGE